MAGLLDSLTREQGLLGLSLLAAAAPKERRTGIGEGLLMASQNVQGMRNAQEERAARMRMQQMQEQQLQMQLADRQRQQQQMEERSRYLSRLDPNQGPPMEHTPAAGMAVGLSPQENAMLMPQQGKGPEYKVVGGRLVRIQGDDVREAYAAPEKPDLNSLIVPGPDGKPMVNRMLLDAKTQIARSGATNVNVGDKSYKDEGDLRKEFAGLPEVASFKKALPAFKAVESAASRTGPQADINLIYGLAKLYDPDSVVREGEYDTIANSQAIPERIKGWAQALAGGGRLTPDTKQQILKEARARIGTFEQQYNAARGTYDGIAGRRGVDGRNIFTPVTAATQTPAQNMPANKDVRLDDGSSIKATLGADGNYYVKRNGKTYRVEE